MVTRTKLFTFLAALALIAAACSSGDSSDTAQVDTANAEAEEATDTDESEEEEGDAAEADEPASNDAPEADSDLINGGKPVVEIASGDSPTELQIDDLITGDGNEAAVGDLLEMHYVGVLFDDGSQFDASWDRDATFNFILGNGNVIQGWDEGIVGMTAGGRRQLTIPAEFAYGDNSPSPDIPPGATLVFVVDLVAAHTPHDFDTNIGDITELDVSTVTEGDGPEVAAGDTVEVLYSLAEPNGPVAQSSWTDGGTATFAVGLDTFEIFPAWSEPLVGTNVGDVVRIVVPPELGPNPESTEVIVTQLTVLGIVEP